MIKGLIFDFDGTLVDTEYAVYQTAEAVYREHNLTIPFDAWVGVAGDGGAFDAEAHLIAHIQGDPAVDHRTLLETWWRRELDACTPLPLCPGVQEYLDDARRLGLKLAIASNSRASWVAGHLLRYGLAEYFDDIVCRDACANGKPDPEVYRIALTGLRLTPDEVIAFEDSPRGIAAAKAAGLYCVAVPNPLTCNLPLADADLRLASLAELPLPLLLAQVQWSPRSRPSPR